MLKKILASFDIIWRAVLIAIGVTLLSLIFFVILLMLLPFRSARIKMTNIYARTLAPYILWLMRTEIVVPERQRLHRHFPAIYLSNHTSALDAVLGMGLCPVGGVAVAKKEIVRVPMIGWVYWLSGHLVIDRSRRDQAVAALNRMAQQVRRYDLGIWMWPEGTRSKNGRLLPFKKGFAHIALATRLPIIPIVAHNVHKKWQKHGLANFSKSKIQIDILEPIITSDWRLESLGPTYRRSVSDVCLCFTTGTTAIALGNGISGVAPG